MNFVVRILWVVVVFGNLTACTGRSTPRFAATDAAVDTDGALTGDASDSFSPGCVGTVAFEHATCTSLTAQAHCPGTQYCEACAMTVATTCACVTYTDGFEYRCVDPCASCSVDAGSSTDGGLVDSGFAVGQSACWINSESGTDNGCLQYPNNTDAEVRAQCENITREYAAMGVNAEYLAECPTADRLGRCVTAELIAWYYPPTTLEGAMSSCSSQMGSWLAD